VISSRGRASALLFAACCLVTVGLQPGRAQAHGKSSRTDHAVRTTSVGLAYGGVSRSYLLFQPTTINKPLPLVILLHGTGVDAQQETIRTGFGLLAQERGFELAVPQSIGRTWNSGGGCCEFEAAQRIDDAGFVRAVLANIRARTLVDAAHIYLVGYSNGGKLSYGVACTKTRVFAGVATYGAGPQLPCISAAPISLFIGYGRADTLEPPAGNPTDARGLHQALARTVVQFVERDRCTSASETHIVGPAMVSTHVACANGTAVQLAEWDHQTHTFPAPPGVPPDASGAALMWQFLSQHKA
jgi:polyhydroxybutyrate depolymerase